MFQMIEVVISVEYEVMIVLVIFELLVWLDSVVLLWLVLQNLLVVDCCVLNWGDILIVVIEINDQVLIQNSLGCSCSFLDKVSILVMVGLLQCIDEILFEGVSMDELVEVKGLLIFKGSGNISCKDKIILRVVVIVIEWLLNGVLCIEGL